MITVLSHFFIKDRDRMEDGSVRRAYGMLCSIVGILLNVLLFAGKYLAGVLSGSIAITADEFNTCRTRVLPLFRWWASGFPG